MMDFTLLLGIRYTVSNALAKQPRWISKASVILSIVTITLSCMSPVKILTTLIIGLAIVVIKARQKIMSRASMKTEDMEDEVNFNPKTNTLVPYELPAFNSREMNHMRVGVRRLDAMDWLIVDKNYLSEHAIRSQILAEKGSKVLRSLPGSGPECLEALELVTAYLSRKYPDMFEINTGLWPRTVVKNKATGERFPIRNPSNGAKTLEVAARLVNEDLNILSKGPDDEEYHLYAKFFHIWQCV